MIHTDDLYNEMSTAQNLAIIELIRAANALKQAAMHMAEIGIVDETFTFMVRYAEARVKDVKGVNIERMVW